MTPPLAYTPFLDPIPIWSNTVWPWLLIPLAVAVSLVYKSIKCGTMRQVPKEAAGIAVWILLGMAAAAAALAALVHGLER